MTARPPFVLDVSRLVSRIGTGPLTGIDRVEAEWLGHLQGKPHLLLCRVRRGQALLPPAAGPAILRWISGDMTGLPSRAGWRDRLARRNTAPARAEAALRRMATTVAPASGRGIEAAARASLTDDAVYLNVGHSNLSRDLLANLADLRPAVMIHDTIPLDHPEFTRQGQSERFRNRLIAALSLSSTIIAISEATADRIALWRGRLAVTARPKIVTAHIGTRLSAADPAAVPPEIDLQHPLFVTLGTIEPRKNHTLLLEVWDRLSESLPAGQVPRLLIVGRRGWENRQVFERLDRLPAGGPITELSGLGDAAVAAILERSHALLMPSLAEGFGLPLTEAAGRGIAILCTDLPSTRELLGDYPTYLPADSPAKWVEQVTALAAQGPLRKTPLASRSWERHFRQIEQAVMPEHDEKQDLVVEGGNSTGI
ncbi:glycosyltransferase family 4 protein [Paracoccus aurantiacus]|uniref:Glycosyltransferase family 4 protein n=1 Tax=Paracoccus aurantiacus TaxID=2599412 RepID=A0A5C6RZP3_9RHOB|nr:glycosyltransferase family 1 protein [Paracoccus aurantiacus]TXB68066.1 glycosyltransferase family 4 protein [Paracoccus aurantiacus]